jgi:hypothetical protein
MLEGLSLAARHHVPDILEHIGPGRNVCTFGSENPSGFVERCFAWIGRNRRLAKATIGLAMMSVA